MGEARTAEAGEVAIAIRDARCVFGRVVAVDGASLALEPSRLHALIGENGAGKSTLLKVAAGLVRPAEGEVEVFGRPLEPFSAREAIGRGVGLVHQHFVLVDAFTALENLVLGFEGEGVSAGARAFSRMDLASARRRAGALMEESGLGVPLERRVSDLTVGERQRLEILRVLLRGARVLLLDEPTAVLSPQEATELYRILRRLADEGRAVAVVTHRLDEVVRFADDVTVMRAGRVVLARRLRGGDAAPEPRDLEAGLVRAIMGREPPPSPAAPPPPGEDARHALEVEALSLDDGAGRALLAGVSLAIKAGEIVGVAGVEGNGQRELVRAIAGLEPRAEGTVKVGGARVPASPGRTPAARRRGLAVVHEDRHVEGLVLGASVGDNLVLGELGPGFDEPAAVRDRMERFAVRPPDPRLRAAVLSGGNQQKIVVARAVRRLEAELLASPGGPVALVVAQPTRGVDVGAASLIHEAIAAAAAKGMGVLVVSADLAELRRLSHRIVVMHGGRIVASLPPDADEEEIGRHMLGERAA